MKKLTAPALLLLLALSGCAGKSAVVSPAVDALALRLAAGAALDADPQYVAPVYAATSAALAVLEGGEPVALGLLEERVTERLDLEARPPEERSALLAVIATVRAELTARLAERGLGASESRIFITELIRVLNETAAIRLSGGGVQGRAGEAREAEDIGRARLCGGGSGLDWPDDAELDAIVEQAAARADAALGLNTKAR